MTCEVCNIARLSPLSSSLQRAKMIQKWLCEITCIKWLEAHAGNPSPCCGSGGEGADDQYGVFYIRSNRYIKSTSSRAERLQNTIEVDDEGEPLLLNCLTVSNKRELSLELRVYNDKGIAVDCEESIDAGIHRSAEDVLTHIHAMTYGNSMDDMALFSFPRGRPDDYDIRAEHRKNQDGILCPNEKIMTMTLCYCHQTSICIDDNTLDIGHCLFNCEGKPLCIAKPDCEE